MSDFFTVEDGGNVRAILVHHLGNPYSFDDDGNLFSRLGQQDFEALEHDLLRYCTRLRCQPDTKAHTDAQGHQVPKHKLTGSP